MPEPDRKDNRRSVLEGACDEVLWMDQNGHMRYRSKDRDAMMAERHTPFPSPGPSPAPSPPTPSPAPMPTTGGGIPIRSDRTTPIPDRFARSMASEGQLGFAGFGRSRPAQGRLFDRPTPEAQPQRTGRSDCGAGSPGDPGFEHKNTCWEGRSDRGPRTNPGTGGPSPTPTPTTPAPTAPAPPIAPRRVTGRGSAATQAMRHPDVQQPLNHWMAAKRLLTWMSGQGPITDDKHYRDVKAALGREQTHRQLAERAMQRLGVEQPGLDWRPDERAQVERLFENMRQYEATGGERREAQQRAAGFWKPQSSVRSTLGQARMIRQGVEGAKEAFPGAATIAKEVAKRVQARRRIKDEKAEAEHPNPFRAMGYSEGRAQQMLDRMLQQDQEQNQRRDDHFRRTGRELMPWNRIELDPEVRRHMAQAPPGSLEHATLQRARAMASASIHKHKRDRRKVLQDLSRELYNRKLGLNGLLWDHYGNRKSRAGNAAKMREDFLMSHALDLLIRQIEQQARPQPR